MPYFNIFLKIWYVSVYVHVSIIIILSVLDSVFHISKRSQRWFTFSKNILVVTLLIDVKCLKVNDLKYLKQLKKLFLLF